MTPAEALVALAREMRLRGLVTATVGNLSARTAHGMLITPTRRDYDELEPEELAEVTLDGERVDGEEPSLEWPLHAAVYRARHDVGGVVHTHSPFAMARSFDPDDLMVRTEECVYLGLDRICVAPPAPGGSAELAASAVATLTGRSGVLLARHGVLGVGRTPRAALEVCATIEHQAIVDFASGTDTVHLHEGGPSAWQ